MKERLDSSFEILKMKIYPHTAILIKKKVEAIRWEFFDHFPYSHFAFGDYFLLLHLKQSLNGQRFENNEKCTTAVVNSGNLLYIEVKENCAALRKVSTIKC